MGASRQERQDKWKGKRCAHQSTGQATVQWCPPDTDINGEKLVNVKQLHAQIAAVSKALAELELSGDKELMQPLESRLAELKARLHGARPIGQQVDGLRGVISRCNERLAEAEIATVEAERTLRITKLNLRNWSHSLLHLRVSQGRWTEQRDARVACKHSVVNRQTRAGEQQYRQRRSCTIPSRASVPSASAYPPDALRSGMVDIATDMCDVSNRGSKHEGCADWPQNTNKVRLTTNTMTEETPQLEDTKGRRRGTSSDS